jgi:hypothetical protein
MKDVKLINGMRCRAEKTITGHQGIVKAKTEGTVQHVIDNLDRQLINVEWDNGVTMYVFPDELEIQETEEAPVILANIGSVTHERNFL